MGPDERFEDGLTVRFRRGKRGTRDGVSLAHLSNEVHQLFSEEGTRKGNIMVAVQGRLRYKARYAVPINIPACPRWTSGHDVSSVARVFFRPDTCSIGSSPRNSMIF